MIIAIVRMLKMLEPYLINISQKRCIIRKEIKGNLLINPLVLSSGSQTFADCVPFVGPVYYHH